MSKIPKDSTRMGEQGALNTSHGRSWIVMGALLLIASAISFGLLIFTPEGKSTYTAEIFLGIVAALYLILVVMRFAIPHQRIRLISLAVMMIAMVIVSLVGLYVAIVIEAKP